MAPPLFTRIGPDGRPKKMKLGPWLKPAMKLLASMRGLRGGAFDVFGYSQERKLERQLLRDYEEMIDGLLPALTPEKLATAVAMAKVPERIRGYGHVKLANLATARARWHELTDRFNGVAPLLAPVPTKVIPIVAARV